MKSPRSGKPSDCPLAPVLFKYLEEGDHSSYSVKESSGGSPSAVSRWKLGEADVQAHSIYNICHFHTDRELGLAVLRTLAGPGFDICLAEGAISDENGDGKIDLKDVACKGTDAAKSALGVVERICRMDTKKNERLSPGNTLDCLESLEKAGRVIGQMRRILLDQVANGRGRRDVGAQ